MKYEEITALLDRYWEGESTLEEERAIKRYFESGDIDHRLAPFAPIFAAIKSEQAVQYTAKAKAAHLRPQVYQWAVAASVALLVGAAWWAFNGGGADKPTAPLAHKEAPKAKAAAPIAPGKAPAVSTESRLAVADASIARKPKALAKKKRTDSAPKPYQELDPETARAMAEIKAALALVSAKLDKGRHQAIKGASYLETVEQVVPKKNG